MAAAVEGAAAVARHTIAMRVTDATAQFTLSHAGQRFTSLTHQSATRTSNYHQVPGQLSISPSTRSKSQLSRILPDCNGRRAFRIHLPNPCPRPIPSEVSRLRGMKGRKPGAGRGAERTPTMTARTHQMSCIMRSWVIVVGDDGRNWRSREKGWQEAVRMVHI
jgi:hypothetical protein